MSKQNENVELDVQYGRKPALYSSQFLINAGAEELTLDCSSTVEVTGGKTVVPVHTRLALSWGAAERLHALLEQALTQRSNPTIPAPHIRHDAAKLPTFGE